MPRSPTLDGSFKAPPAVTHLPARPLRVFAVVPARDEAARLGQVLETMPAAVERIVVVDDGSRDGTAKLARGHARVVLIQHRSTRGVGAALTSGYRAAFDAGADVAVVMAGDGQMDPADLDALLGPIATGAALYSKGTRLRTPSVVFSMPPARLVGNLVLTGLTRWATGLPITDSQCGYTALHRSAAARIDIETLWPRYGYPNDLLARCARAGIAVAEVPVKALYRGEKSGLRLRDAVVWVPWVIARGALRR